MELSVVDGNAIQVSEVAFGVEFNESLVHQVVTAQMAGERQGTKKQKNRSDVSGSTKKPWRQKGTGRARAGNLRSPIWRSGGATFAARPRSFEQKVNKKMFRGAMRSILSELVRQDRIMIVNDFSVDAPKTKVLANKLSGMGLSDVLILTEKVDESLYLAARNMPKVQVKEATRIDPVKLLKYGKVLATVGAIRMLEEAYK